ncbi:MAG: CDP-glucose 4,6-dehydratase [Candidatus Protistobacter heckmanni]|nr:CDP-glucose 4,6-dehydratase [Candidatus Protistobacter heckmanni]
MGALSMRDALASFAGKRVFITGHTGFKGSWLTFLLKEAGADVTGYALAPEPGPSHFELLKLAPRIHHIVGDIADAAALKKALLDFQPEYVFHLAAQALVKRSYQDPVGTFQTNVMGSVHLLEAVRHCASVRSLVYITSDKCYENVEWVWGYRENDRLGGRDPYSASKGAAEVVFSAYARSYLQDQDGLGAASTRAGNVIGGGDWAADRIIPDCVRAIEAGKPIVLRNPNATRPWQHVLEPLSGYVLLAANLHARPQAFDSAWNFGPSSIEVRTVEDVARAIVASLGRGSIQVEQPAHAQHEAQLLQLNCDKAHQQLGWSPRWPVDKTLDATAHWYAAYLGGKDVEEVTRAQIHDYFPELP